MPILVPAFGPQTGLPIAGSNEAARRNQQTMDAVREKLRTQGV